MGRRLGLKMSARIQLGGAERKDQEAMESMTMHEKDDPNRETHRCMRCNGVEFYRNVSTLSNSIRIWLCNDCQRKLTEIVRAWLEEGSVAKSTGETR